MEKTNLIYNAAWKDMRLNNIPYRQPDSIYVWNQGQLAILSSTEHSLSLIHI